MQSYSLFYYFASAKINLSQTSQMLFAVEPIIVVVMEHFTLFMELETELATLIGIAKFMLEKIDLLTLIMMEIICQEVVITNHEKDVKINRLSS